MWKKNMQEKIDLLFSVQENGSTFENHMPTEVGTFLQNVSKDEIDHDKLSQDIKFAKSLSGVLSFE